MKRFFSGLMALVMGLSFVTPDTHSLAVGEMEEVSVEENLQDSEIFPVDGVEYNKELESLGGEVDFQVFTSPKVGSEFVKIQAKLGKEIVKLDYNVEGEKAKKTIKIQIPENKTSSDQVYTINFNSTGSEKVFQESPSATVKVKAGTQVESKAVFSDLTISSQEFPLEGGEQKVSIRGENLKAEDIILKLFKDGEEVPITEEIMPIGLAGTNTIQSTRLKIGQVDKDTSYKLIVTVADQEKSVEFKQVASGSVDDLQLMQPKEVITVNDDSLIVRFDHDIFEAKEGSIKSGFKISSNEGDISIGDADKLIINGEVLQINFADKVFGAKTNLMLEVASRSLKDVNGSLNKEFKSFIEKDGSFVTDIDFIEGYQNPPEGGKVSLKIKGYNLPDDLKVKIQENNKEKTLVYQTESENNLISDLKLEGDSNEKTITFTAPANTGEKLKTYIILISTDGGNIYLSNLSSSLENRFEKPVFAVFAKGEDPSKANISFMQIQSYSTPIDNEKDITHTDLPTGQESKKTLVWIYGTNLDSAKTRIRLKDYNGVYWSPIHDAVFDSSDRVMMTMMDGMNDSESFGMSGSGNNMVMEVILPNSYRADGLEGFPKGVTFEYEVAPDKLNFNQEVTVTGTVLDDGSAKTNSLADNLISLKVRHVDKDGKDIVESKEIKAYKNLPPNVFYETLPLIDDKGDFRVDFIGYKVADTDQLVVGEEGYGHDKFYYYDKNLPDLINSNNELILVYDIKASSNENEVVDFADKNIKKEVVNLLTDATNLYDATKVLPKDKKEGYNPTVADMENIKNLWIGPLYDDNFNNLKATSLRGLEKAKNAVNIKFSHLKAPDMDLVKNFKFAQVLNLTANDIKDLSYIADLENLKELNISANNLESLQGIEKLTGLEKLTADTNRISDLSPLKSLTSLKELILHHNKISDISPLKDLENLEKLWLSDNFIKDISQIGNKPLLKDLQLNGVYTGPYEKADDSGNAIKDISVLANMKNLQSLYLQDTVYIEDLSPLKDLTNLEVLVLRGNNISDISPLEDLTNLSTLYLYKNKVTDISPLKNMTEMVELNFAVNSVEDISVLKNMPKLDTIMAYDNEISDISPIGDTKASTINLSLNKITDLSPLKENIKREDYAAFGVFDRQEAEMDGIILESKQKDDRIEYVIENVIKLADANPIRIDGNTLLNEEDYEYFEIGDSVEKYNKIVQENNDKGIKIYSRNDDKEIVIDLPKDLAEENLFVNVPFASFAMITSDKFEGEAYGSYGGSVKFKLAGKKTDQPTSEETIAKLKEEIEKLKADQASLQDQNNKLQEELASKDKDLQTNKDLVDQLQKQNQDLADKTQKLQDQIASLQKALQEAQKQNTADEQDKDKLAAELAKL
ncbi:MAG: leucine-rich repeat domain-containing protein, partial [Finegoldia sp.]|nr:leucine-rich repeat domain-containing protein [Finegoldia sp.]